MIYKTLLLIIALTLLITGCEENHIDTLLKIIEPPTQQPIETKNRHVLAINTDGTPLWNDESLSFWQPLKTWTKVLGAPSRERYDMYTWDELGLRITTFENKVNYIELILKLDKLEPWDPKPEKGKGLPDQIFTGVIKIAEDGYLDYQTSIKKLQQSKAGHTFVNNGFLLWGNYVGGIGKGENTLKVGITAWDKERRFPRVLSISQPFKRKPDTSSK